MPDSLPSLFIANVPFSLEAQQIIFPFDIVTGFTGGMGGCAMIGQTMIKVKASGARPRISTFLAGVFLRILVVALGGVVFRDPNGALVAVMIFISWATFDWHNVHPRTLKMMPKSETRLWSSPSSSPSPPIIWLYA